MSGRTRLYESGQDMVLSTGPYIVGFNDGDFYERLEYAARRVHLIDSTVQLADEELADLTSLILGRELPDPPSPLGRHIVQHSEEFLTKNDRQDSLADWLRKIILRHAYFDGQMMEGSDVDAVFQDHSGDFVYVHGSNRQEISHAAEPSWAHVAYRPGSPEI